MLVVVSKGRVKLLLVVEWIEGDFVKIDYGRCLYYYEASLALVG